MTQYASVDKPVARSTTGYVPQAEVVSVQPVSVPISPTGQWQSGLFDCCNDCESFWCVLLCIPCAYGRIVQMYTNMAPPKSFYGDVSSCCLFLAVVANVCITCCLTCEIR